MNSTFTMEGGTIFSNESRLQGGGVLILGAFNMNSGSINNNTTQTGEGGGVYVNGGSTFQ